MSRIIEVAGKTGAYTEYSREYVKTFCSRAGPSIPRDFVTEEGLMSWGYTDPQIDMQVLGRNGLKELSFTAAPSLERPFYRIKFEKEENGICSFEIHGILLGGLTRESAEKDAIDLIAIMYRQGILQKGL